MAKQPAHPGRIIYVDGDSGAIVSERDVGEVPESGRFVHTERGPVPVVRVEASVAGDKRFIKEYGPGNELLRTTVQIRDPSPTAGS